MSESEAWRTSTTVAEYRAKLRALSEEMAADQLGVESAYFGDEGALILADQLRVLGNMALEDADTINRRILVEQMKGANDNVDN